MWIRSVDQNIHLFLQENNIWAEKTLYFLFKPQTNRNKKWSWTPVEFEEGSVFVQLCRSTFLFFLPLPFPSFFWTHPHTCLLVIQPVYFVCLLVCFSLSLYLLPVLVPTKNNEANSLKESMARIGGLFKSTLAQDAAAKTMRRFTR